MGTRQISNLRIRFVGQSDGCVGYINIQGIALSQHAPDELNLRQSISTQKNRCPLEYAPSSLCSPGAKKATTLP